MADKRPACFDFTALLESLFVVVHSGEKILVRMRWRTGLCDLQQQLSTWYNCYYYYTLGGADDVICCASANNTDTTTNTV